MSAETYTPKVFAEDSTPAQRRLYVDVCDDLAATPLVENPMPLAERVTMSCRCDRDDRVQLADLAREMGITQNALLLLSARMGMLGIREARAERLR